MALLQGGRAMSASRWLFPVNVAFSGGYAYLGDLAGALKVVDPSSRQLVSSSDREWGLYTFRFLSDGYKTYGVAMLSSSQPSKVYRISPASEFDELGTIQGHVLALDDRRFYGYSSRWYNNASHYHPYVVDKDLKNRRDGHFLNRPDLVVHEFTLDAQSAWFVCTDKAFIGQQLRQGVTLVRRTRGTDQINVFPLSDSFKWTSVQVANDTEAVWLRFTYADVYEQSENLVMFDKRTETFHDTGYHGVNRLIPNVETEALPERTLAEHKNRVIYALERDLVIEGRPLDAVFVLGRNGVQRADGKSPWLPDVPTDIDMFSPPLKNLDQPGSVESENRYARFGTLFFARELWMGAVPENVNAADNDIKYELLIFGETADEDASLEIRATREELNERRQSTFMRWVNGIRALFR